MIHAILIDDDLKNMMVLEQLLLEEKVTCTKIADVTNLEAILETIEHIDIIFLDLEMPVIDGYTLIQQLQANQQVQSVPIIAHSVHLSELNTVAQKGFHSFIGKPIDADKFPLQLARILNGEHVWETH